MPTLAKELRRVLERTVLQARTVAEDAAAATLTDRLAVDRHEAWPNMTVEERALRNRLRARGRQLGDERDAKKGTQEVARLVQEVAYEHWHRMLFARFLAENQLLLEPDHGVAVSLADVRELARERGTNWVELASGYAVRMLPAVFRAGDPVLEVTLPREARKALEDLLEGLPAEVFQADDSLGWVYQFWQSKQKDAINERGEKIGAEELGPVTQLFTEDYMVEFLLHNTIGAWWAGKLGPISAATEEEARGRAALSIKNGLGVPWTYLRFIQDDTTKTWRPAAGTFDGWPRAAKDITYLDPCMGSGHFPVFALRILARLRMEEDGLPIAAAFAAVLRDNLYGLELDERCTQIAAFNVALTAWKLGGYQTLPALHFACSGLAPNVPESEWLKLASKNENLQRGMVRLHRLFKHAPVLGSLINPRAEADEILIATYQDLEPLLQRALAKEAEDDATHEMAVTASGVAKAARILASEFTLVATNVPYLTRQAQSESLRDYCERAFPTSKADLATCFVQRGLRYLLPAGTLAVVAPTNWLYQPAYKHFRRAMLAQKNWHAVARLGPGAFEGVSGEVVNVTLVVVGNDEYNQSTRHAFSVDATAGPSASGKAELVRNTLPSAFDQASQLSNPDARIILGDLDRRPLLSLRARSLTGLRTADNPQFMLCFWEVSRWGDTWVGFQSTVVETTLYGGREHVLRWDEGHGSLEHFADLGLASLQGEDAWNRRGITVSLMGNLPVTLYSGNKYDMNCGAVWPHNESELPSVWAFCSSEEFTTAVRRIDQQLKLTTATLLKVPFDATHWQRVAAEKYPAGLPKPHSDDPMQWLFNGHPKGSEEPLQVAVARLLGYQWPRHTGSSFLDCPALGPDGLEALADADGIVCLTSLKGEDPGALRLQKLLAVAYGKEWSAEKQAELLTAVDYVGETIETWLRDGFFEQHCQLFHQRPFIWHVWDGREDGFHALVNYHKLAAPDAKGQKTLEKLTYSYLGDWVDRQRAEQKAGIEGADARLAAALHLQAELKKILEGEPPYDLFVRWKPVSKQAIGWAPDTNDGVRMNIRPFMTARPLGARAKGACILRVTPRIKWDKDRGKEPERPKAEYPWFWGWDEETGDFEGGRQFDGNRWNDLHYTGAVKQAAHEPKSRERSAR